MTLILKFVFFLSDYDATYDYDYDFSYDTCKFFVITVVKNLHSSYFVRVSLKYVSLFSGGDEEESQSSGQCCV